MMSLVEKSIEKIHLQRISPKLVSKCRYFTEININKTIDAKTQQNA